MTPDHRQCRACGKTGGIYDYGTHGPECGACAAEVKHAEAAYARGRAVAANEAAVFAEMCASEHDDVVDQAALSGRFDIVNERAAKASQARFIATRIRALSTNDRNGGRQ